MPATFLMDSVAPTTTDLATQQPIIWTSNRIYDFLSQVPVSTNKAAAYKSTDGGVTWTTPDLTHATVCHEFFDWFWDGSSHTVVLGIISAGGGVQSPILQNFDLNSETYSATFGASGAPSETFVGTVKIAQTADGHIMFFYAIPSTGVNSRCKFAIYNIAGATWSVGTTDIATNVVGPYSQWETIIPDPANNLCHVYYADNGLNFYYRQIHSDGTLGTITTFTGGSFNNIHIGNLNAGRAFNTGFLDTATNTLVTPVFTRVSSIFSLNVITGSPSTSATPTFSISSAIDTASSSVLGQDIGQAVAFKNQLTGNYQVLYFIGDGTNLYNLVKLATFSSGVWTTTTIYNAATDPNAGKNTSNNQWLNTISGESQANGNFVFQASTWLTLAGQSFQNTAVLTTLVGAAAPVTPPPVSPSVGGAWFFSSVPLLRIILPDPKACKSPDQLRIRQWQKGFTICEK